MENNKIHIFLLLSLILHLIILLFFIDSNFVKNIFYIKLNETTSSITVQDYRIVSTEKGEDRVVNETEQIGEKAGALTEEVKGISNPAPEYPAMALEWGYEGVVKLRISIDTTGKVYKVKIIKSSGYNILDDEAKRTAYKWIFKKLDKKITIEKEIEFKIKKAP